MRLLSLSLIGGALLTPAALADPAIESNGSSRQELSITIYNDNLAMVRDVRRVELPKGEVRLELQDVSAQINAPSALLEMDGVSVLEQNFDYDLLTPEALIRKAVGQTVRIYRPHPETGEDRVEEARILAANDGVILDIDGRIEILRDLPGRIVFADLPPALRERPTLSTLLQSSKSGKRTLSLSYLTGGLEWRADYAAMLSGDETSLDLKGWITLTNRSGADFVDANTQLVAGEVNRAEDYSRYLTKRGDREEIIVTASRVQQESLSDYHLYTLPRKTTIADNQTKQVSFLEAPKVRVAKEYRFSAWNFGGFDRPQAVNVYLQSVNDHDHGLGLPLPEGVIRVYAKDKRKSAQFIGEDRLPSVAENNPWKIRLGESFDVTVTGKLEERELVESNRDRKIFTATQSYEINNARDAAVTVHIKQDISYAGWELLEESLPHSEKTGDAVIWPVTVPAKAKARLTFKVRTEQ